MVARVYGSTNVDHVREAIRFASKVVIFTGAGLGKESGIPTFEDGLKGVWAKYRPSDLAGQAAFDNGPALVWHWYRDRLALAQIAEPNTAHQAIAALERARRGVTVITMNVDGLHTRAGSQDVLELHGNLAYGRRLTDNGLVPLGRAHELKVPPTCPETGAPLRPNVVRFGEALPSGAFARAIHAAMHADLVLVIGTRGQVEPAASLARMNPNALVVEINPQRSALTGHVDLWLQCGACTGMFILTLQPAAA